MHELSNVLISAGVLVNHFTDKAVRVNLIISGVYNNKVRMAKSVSTVASGLPS
jgi:hypothetical protein